MPRFSRRSAALLLQIVGWPLLGLVAVARFSRVHRSWLVEFVDVWLFHLLLPWPALGAVAAWGRSWSLGLLALLGSAFSFECALMAVGRARSPLRDPGPRVRVLTANVLGTNPDAAALAALIARERPDIVALQEVRPRFAADLEARLGGELPYRAIEPRHSNAGAALLSRLPFEAIETAPLGSRGHLSQRARLKVDGRTLHVFNIHFDTPFEIYRRTSGWPPFGIRRRVGSLRHDELTRLVELVTHLDGPLVVVGDFNTSAGSYPHRRLLRHLRDAFLEVGRGLGLTWPRPTSIHGLKIPVPLLRIDYTFCKGPLSPCFARPLPHPGSDHRALLTEFVLHGHDGEVGDGCGSRLTAAASGAVAG